MGTAGYAPKALKQQRYILICVEVNSPEIQVK